MQWYSIFLEDSNYLKNILLLLTLRLIFSFFAEEYFLSPDDLKAAADRTDKT